MPPKQVKLKRPVQSPPQNEEEKELKLASDEIIKAIGEGVFDTHLDLIDKAITTRIRQSQEEDPDEIEPRRDTVEKIRVLRSSPPELVWNRTYRLRGEKYAGVMVSFLDLVGNADGGMPKAKVTVDTGNQFVSEGKIYMVPAAALEEIPDMVGTAAKDKPYGHSLKLCKKCGGDIEYSGTGRPRILCEKCR